MNGLPKQLQLDYVDKYLNKWKSGGKVKTLADLYIIVFTPAYAGNSQNFIVGSQSGTATQKAIYKANPAFQNSKGYFTIADIGLTISKWANYKASEVISPNDTTKQNYSVAFLVFSVLLFVITRKKAN